MPRLPTSTCLFLASPARQPALLLKHDPGSIPSAPHDRFAHAFCAPLPCRPRMHDSHQTCLYPSRRYLATTPRPAVRSPLSWWRKKGSAASRPSPEITDIADQAPEGEEGAAQKTAMRVAKTAKRAAKTAKRAAEGTAKGAIVAPPRRGPKVVSAAKATKKAGYTPAISGTGLEWVGGLKGWWDKGDHVGKQKFVGFAPRRGPRWNQRRQLGPDKHASAVLEVLARRAVVEALAWRRGTTTDPWKSGAQPKALWETHGGSRLALAVKLKVNPTNGSCEFVGSEWEQVWQNLNMQRKKDEAIPPFEWSQVESFRAKSLACSWDDGWKMISLQDPVLRFAVAKRVQRLTGQMVPDAMLLGIETVGALVGHLTATPKARRVVDFFQQQPTLPSIPNVSVFRRRVTPVDKEKMVGRWKLIKSTLEKRDLPVLGTKGYGPFVETKWIYGPGTTQTAKQPCT